MYWLQVLWAVVRGLAAGISACYWDDFVASQQGKKPGQQPRPDPSKGPAAPSEPAAGVRVDPGRKEGEFAAGVPYMGGAADPRLRPTQAAPPTREGESRRKRRSQPAAPTPAEQVCARCKSALGHELTTVPADLAVAQEAADQQPPAVVPQAAAARTEVNAQSTAPSSTEPTAASAEQATASKVKWERPPLLDRLVTRLSTRGALTRLVESASALPSGA